MPSTIAQHSRTLATRSSGPVRTTLGVCALGLVLMSLWAPVVQSSRGYPAGEGAYRALTHICHQYPSRCVWVAGRPMALCAVGGAGTAGRCVRLHRRQQQSRVIVLEGGQRTGEWACAGPRHDVG
jgi:hypothetical protein